MGDAEKFCIMYIPVGGYGKFSNTVLWHNLSKNYGKMG